MAGMELGGAEDTMERMRDVEKRYLSCMLCRE